MPIRPATRKATGTATSRLARIEFGQVGPHRLLHDEGHIGADHHHLAMRHVDDAHDAEGDRQTGRRQQQHRAEAKPVIDILQDAPQLQPPSIAATAVPSRLRHRLRLRPSAMPASRPRAARSPRSRNTATAAIRSSTEASGEKSIEAARACCSRSLTAAIGFLRQGAVERRQRGRVVRLEHRLGRLEPQRRIGREQAQAAERRGDRVAHRVVDAHRLQRRRGNIRGRLAGIGGDETPSSVLMNSACARADIQFAGLQRADAFRPRADRRRPRADPPPGGSCRNCRRRAPPARRPGPAPARSRCQRQR